MSARSVLRINRLKLDNEDDDRQDTHQAALKGNNMLLVCHWCVASRSGRRRQRCHCDETTTTTTTNVRKGYKGVHGTKAGNG